MRCVCAIRQIKKKEGKEVGKDDFQTACSAACTSGSMVFGDVNNKETMVSQLTMDDRAFGVLEEIHTLPSVSYLTRVINNEEIKA